MRIRLAIPDRHVTPETLEAILAATTLANQSAIEKGELPPITQAIQRGVRWREEPFTDGEHFDLGNLVAQRGWGDCDDLAPWLAGELRATGQDPDARPHVYQTGPKRWHVVVRTSDGTILDPSRWAGMGRKSVNGGCANGVCGIGAAAKPMARSGDGALCVMPRYGSYYARADMPYPDSDAHIASLSRARTPDRALDLAVSGAIACSNGMGIPTDRLIKAGSILLGDAEELDQVGLLPLAATLAPMAMEQGQNLLKGLLAKGSGATLFKLQAKAMESALRKKGLSEEQIAQALQGFKEQKYKKLAAQEAAAVSVPVEPAPPAPEQQHMMLTYYPQGSQGPVVMRF